MITEPGIYDMSSEDYHADPCPAPSLSSSGAHTLAFECPAQFDYDRKNPTHKQVFDIGTASHLMTLEPDLFNAQVVVVRGETKTGKPSDGYGTKEAKDQRDAAYADGKTPLLVTEMELVANMRKALMADPIGSKAFTNGKAEQSIFWQDAEFGIWRRTRPDWVPNHGRYLINWKTAASAHPDDIGRAIYTMGYFQKCAWEMQGFEAVTGAPQTKFCLLVQSKKPPHVVVPVWLSLDDLAWGQIANRYACGLYAWCTENNVWPGFASLPDADLRGFDDIRMPAWAVRQLEARDAAGGFDPPTLSTVA